MIISLGFGRGLVVIKSGIVMLYLFRFVVVRLYFLIFVILKFVIKEKGIGI